MWEYIFGGATIFALIVGLFSIYNGRATRKLILELMKRTQELIVEESDKTRKILEEHGRILEKLSEQHVAMINILKSSKSGKS